MLGDTPGAKADFEKSLDLKPDYVQSLVKVASVHMEMGDAAGAFGDFEAAIRHNANDPDIYYHRGQRESDIGRNLFPFIWLIYRLFA